MQLMQLDFHRVAKPTPWIGLALVTAGVVALMWVAVQQDVVTQRRQQIETTETDLAWKKKQQQYKQQEAQKEKPADEKLAAIRRAQQVSALPALEVIESAWTRDIGLTRLELSPTDHDVKLELEARRADDLLELIDALTRNPNIQRVVLARQSVKQNDPFKPTQAGLEVFLKGAPR